MTYEVTIPEIGESITEAVILRWIRNTGDHVGRDEPLVELETDKVTVEMPSPVAGVVSEIVAAEGETVPIGGVIARIEEGAAAGAGSIATSTATAPAAIATVGAQTDLLAAADTVVTPAPGPAPAPAAPPPADTPAAPAAPATTQASTTAEAPRILPAAKRLIAEHDLDAGAISARARRPAAQSDVVAYLALPRGGTAGACRADPAAAPLAAAAEPAPRAAPAAPPATAPPQPAAAAAGPAGDRAEERVTMTPIRRRIAERLVESQQQAALLTTFNEIDMSAVKDFRSQYRNDFEKRHDVRLGFLSFFVKAAVDALRRFPRLNAEVSGTDIIYRNYHDIGIAVSTDRGLMVPVLRSAERMSFAGIEGQIADFAGRARTGRIQLQELQGGTFTITNGGIFGSLLSTPIINPPQSGVLGLHAIQDRPMVVDGEIVVKPMMYVALTYDHRIVDGREAVSFLVRIKEAIQDPARMLIEV